MSPDDSLSASEQIRNLISLTALSQDDRDWAAHASCFAPDARYTHPKGEIHGTSAIIERSQGALSTLDRSQHLIGSVYVQISGSTATAISYFQAQHVRAAAPGGSLFVIAGTYRDTLALRDGRWMITHRHQDYSWREGNPDVIVR